MPKLHKITFVLLLLLYLSAESVAQTYSEIGKLRQKNIKYPRTVNVSLHIKWNKLGLPGVINYNNLALMGKGLVMDYNMLPLLRVAESCQGTAE